MQKVVARQRRQRQAVTGPVLYDVDQQGQVFVEYWMFEVQQSPFHKIRGFVFHIMTLKLFCFLLGQL